MATDADAQQADQHTDDDQTDEQRIAALEDENKALRALVTHLVPEDTDIDAEIMDKVSVLRNGDYLYNGDLAGAQLEDAEPGTDADGQTQELSTTAQTDPATTAAERVRQSTQRPQARLRSRPSKAAAPPPDISKMTIDERAKHLAEVMAPAIAAEG